MEQELLGYINQWAWVPDERKDLSDIDNLWWLYRELYKRELERRTEQNGPRAMEIIRVLIGQMEA
jgi:hypothetical protein